MIEISKHSMVTLAYDLHIDDREGEIIESATEEKPLQFLYGAGSMLPKFESYLAGLRQGEVFEINLSKFDAYGDVDDEAVVDLPKDVFIVDGVFDDELVSLGNTVPMMSSNGQRLNGLVIEINDDYIKMDFNHPLAGEDLYFSGRVLEVREPSDDELARILSGGCGCGSGGGCCSDNDDGCGCGSDNGHNGGGCGCGC